MESLVRKKHDEGLKIVNFTKVEGLHIIWKININKSHCNKTLHLFVEGLVDIGASMLVMSTIVVHELSIMHLISGSKFYKIAFGVVINAFNKINELPTRIKDVQCLINFMVVDINSSRLSLCLSVHHNAQRTHLDIDTPLHHVRIGLT